ncbi:MAG: bifunctional 23S rRNA (guanine(2069)-N(7))-methyltransferase RlmK/23S rRNA (guanine(2445)-N(2))-methyltransferase RlmL, partial [Gammaproteobacteria bacterium]|nr:bifunctional 23S rRNA (guanine(2069)-N(7))-methyltransferase RlmK/23S rRNA (guanine(2445)-N(2))-methyltransferase RlmL [Gammaproteobacteria bacterium]
MTKNFFATAPKGMEPLLADELRMLGAENLKLTRAGVAFEGPLQLGYRVCLWSRIANRVLLPLESFDISTADDLYAGVQSVRWDEHLAPDGSLAVDFAGFHAAITHTHFGALKVKDAIVDQFRTRYGVRPSVELKQPDVRINLYLHKGRATVSLDLSGESLHRRGYRETGAPAPLKENLAAAILMKAGWPAIARAGGALIDPMCGSGTLPIEAALMAADIAPGLLHSRYGFLHWRQHSENIWTELLAEARERKIETLPPIIGYDADARAVHSALRNVELAGLQKHVHIERQALANLSPVHKAGLVAINPPYGERLGDIHELKPLYTLLGERLRERFQGWQAALLAGNSELGKQLGIRARRLSTLYNGALPCKLLCFDVDPQWFMRSLEKTAKPAPSSQSAELSSGAQMFANRLRKNLRSLKSWVKNEKVSCYRVYDADIPEYAVAVDKYEQWVHVQEYAAPASIDKEKARMHLQDVMTAIPRVLETQSVFLKVRLRQKGNAQYEKLASSGKFYEVHEGDAVFLVNFTDYLDTGLFLDQRLTRKLIRQHAEGRRFLNLFSYTGSATIAA